MTPIEFIQKAESSIFTSLLKQTNELLAQNKTAFLATGLFLQLPCTIQLEQSDYLDGPFKKLSLQDLTDAVSVDVINDKVTFTFIYKNEKHLKHLLKASEKYSEYYSYQYFMSLQRVLRQQLTSSYEAAMFRLVQDREEPFYLIHLASTYAINRTVIEILNMIPQGPKWNDVKELIALYPNPACITEAQILADMAKTKVKLKIKKAHGKYMKVEATNLEYLTEEKIPAADNPDFGGAQSIEKQDRALVNIANQLQSSISTSTKGTGIGTLMNQLFDEIKIDSKWFQSLRKSFSTDVYHKTNEGYSTWENLSSTYRHIYSAPVQHNIDKKVRLIVSLDTSASVHTSELQKVLSIIKDNSTKIAECIVMHHTTDVIEQFHLQHPDDIQQDHNFKKALNCRIASGGTSHKAVFKAISKLPITNPEDWIYMAMSDFYSDVESVLPQYPKVSQLSTYWVGTSDGRKLNKKLVPGVMVTMP